jgi:prepilin-type N-terminal cleavage/methylation domain-containing protein
MAAPRNDERGFTIVEVLVAILILTVASMTTFTLLSAATRNAQRAKATQVALEFAEQEMERLRSMSDEQLALESVPGHVANSLSPDFRVRNGEFALQRSPVGNYWPLVRNGGTIYGVSEKVIEHGVVSPGPTPFTSGDVSGDVYRYIVWRDDEACGEACPGRQDYKQIVVAVKLNAPPSQAAERGYVEVQSNFVSPTDNAEGDPTANSDGKVITAQQFFLTDTPCSSAGTMAAPTERQEITGDHLLHNTLGTCSSGMQTGSENEGAPDALLLGSPPDPAPADPTVPALYDYSDDTYLEPTPDTDKGLQIEKDTTNGCNYVPSGTTHPEAQVHRWVTDKMTVPFVLTEKVTLEIYTRTLNDALYSGKLCIYLFDRHETGSPPVAEDTMLINPIENKPYWTYAPENEYWPRFEWAKVRKTMTFSGPPKEIPAGDRLGLALSVERNAMGEADAIPVLYDHPTYAARIEVDTSTPINGG